MCWICLKGFCRLKKLRDLAGLEHFVVVNISRANCFCKYFAAVQGALREVYQERVEPRVSDRKNDKVLRKKTQKNRPVKSGFLKLYP